MSLYCLLLLLSVLYLAESNQQQIEKRGKIQTQNPQNLHENTERLRDYQQIVPFRLLLFTNQICQISEFLSVFEI